MVLKGCDLIGLVEIGFGKILVYLLLVIVYVNV